MEDPTSTVDAPKPLKFRRTRIAVSVFFGMLTLAVCVAWIRSNSHYERLSKYDGTLTQIGLNNWYAFFGRSKSAAFRIPHHGWQVDGTWATETPARFRWTSGPDHINVTMPFWFLVFIPATISAASGSLASLPKRFSLRIMLIATTLLGVVLGLAVWLAR